MKRPQLIGLAIAATAGLMAFMMVRGLVSKPPVQKTVEVKVKSSDVLVARTDIGLGQITNDSLFRWQSWPEETVTAGFITRTAQPDAMTQLAGSIARAPIMAGEPITQQKLVKAGQGGVLAAILPAGMRAISTRIKEETAVGNLILPNDRVDVILIRRLRGRSGQEEYVSDLLFGNVRVLAIGQQIETKEGKKTADGAATTATLELTARQAELLALGNSMGDISLSLRSIADLDVNQGPTAGIDPSVKESTAIRVLRYGTASRSYGVN
ncbi:MAG: Flp pilus assembly protein CpaB [Hyphomicrobium zavarzinii]|jgi:pilus assembly protein CpaB|uniref:Flp pilus assembly protein CpaB n=1 Tax=Hyphomicrobium TaxID=81 RepID=UPI000365C505|nr:MULTISPECIES: Flp pilus assembly protein CpaB [Hyphomicrobium]MBL8844419.1 Flp pilus assembly protein CpaB [Hyphomicrobium zavarzinii]WBT39422.1 Flp pilus assembly protein CpaB [Hyphomicrobium sp. DMF-1]